MKCNENSWKIHKTDNHISNFKIIFKNSDESIDFTDLSPSFFFCKVCVDGTPCQVSESVSQWVSEWVSG